MLVDNIHYRSWNLALSHLPEGQAILENQNEYLRQFD
jgi:hypothetical protein